MARPKGWKISRSTFELLLVVRRMTQADVASAGGISPQMVSDVVGPRRAGASIKTASAIADALECRVEVLFPEAEGFLPAEQPVSV